MLSPLGAQAPQKAVASTAQGQAFRIGVPSLEKDVSVAQGRNMEKGLGCGVVSRGLSLVTVPLHCGAADTHVDVCLLSVPLETSGKCCCAPSTQCGLGTHGPPLFSGDCPRTALVRRAECLVSSPNVFFWPQMLLKRTRARRA